MIRCIKFKRISPITNVTIEGWVYNFYSIHTKEYGVVQLLRSTNGVSYDVKECELLPFYKEFKSLII